jgi:hypothetical protein
MMMTQREHLHRRIRMAWKKTKGTGKCRRRLLAAKAFWFAVNKWVVTTAETSIRISRFFTTVETGYTNDAINNAAGPYHMSKLLGDTADPVSKDPSTDDIHLVVREG